MVAVSKADLCPAQDTGAATLGNLARYGLGLGFRIRIHRRAPQHPLLTPNHLESISTLFQLAKISEYCSSSARTALTAQHS